MGQDIAAVTLDLFGTLVDFSIPRDERPLVADLLEEKGSQADPDAVLETWVAESLEERGRTPFRTVRASIERGAQATAVCHGLDIDHSYWASALETLWATRPLRDGVPALVDELEARGIPWAVVTNLDDPVLTALVRRTGLSAPAVVTSHRARAYKPHPRPFRMTTDRLGVEPRQVLHVGDSPGEDRAGARAAGMQVRIVDTDAAIDATVLDALEG